MSHVYLVDNQVIKRMKEHCTLSYLQKKYPARTWEPIKESIPSSEDLREWMNDGGCCTPICDCWVEADGHCEHGRPSWLMALGWV